MEQKVAEFKSKLNEVLKIMEELGFKRNKIEIMSFGNTESESKKIIESLGDCISSAGEEAHWVQTDLTVRAQLDQTRIVVACFYDSENPKSKVVS
jgi:hypothetical protein